LVPYIGDDGRQVIPTKPNAIKLETFIFDLLPKAKNALVVEVDESRAFAPLKNASGAAKDTPESCRAAIVDLHRDWLRSAGVEVSERVLVEINPRFALDAVELKQKLPATTRITNDQYFCLAQSQSR
jgi:UDP-N-acetylglucosamine/UDP-N-acetylgalactosamine diphosphorylase